MNTTIKQFYSIPFFLLLFTTSSFTQKIKFLKGNLDFLKGQTNVNVQYDYSDMLVGKSTKEEDYVNRLVLKKNLKEPGSGEIWAVRWEADRNARFEPKFEELFNKQMANYGMKVGNYPDVEYTIILHTYRTSPGYNIGVKVGHALIDTDIWFVETKNKQKIEAKLTLIKIVGHSPSKKIVNTGLDYDVGYRIQEAYALCGKTLADYIKKKVF